MSGEQPGRYQRSTSGLVAALVVTLVAVGALVTGRELLRRDVVTEPEPVDYLATVRYAQESDVDVVYPRSLPAGWIATSVDLVPGERPAWGIGLLTDDERFVGVRQEQRSLGSLLETYVDEETSGLPEALVDSQVADRWQVFEDEGGDQAYAARTGGTVVLVYGSAPRVDLERIVAELTTTRLPAAAR